MEHLQVKQLTQIDNLRREEKYTTFSLTILFLIVVRFEVMNYKNKAIDTNGQSLERGEGKVGSFWTIYSGQALVHGELNRRAIGHQILMLVPAVRSFSSGNHLAVHVYDAAPFRILHELPRR